LKILALAAVPNCKHHDPLISVVTSDYRTIMPPLANTVANTVANAVANTVANTVANAVANTVANTVANAVANTVANAVANTVANALANTVANAVAQLLRGLAVWRVLKQLDKLELQEPSVVLTYQRRLFHNVPNH
jgi:hypothetical protein